MARIAAEEWDNPDEARGEAGPVLSKVEIYVPLLVPWPESPHLASFSSPLMSPLRTEFAQTYEHYLEVSVSDAPPMCSP